MKLTSENIAKFKSKKINQMAKTTPDAYFFIKFSLFFFGMSLTHDILVAFNQVMNPTSARLTITRYAISLIYGLYATIFTRRKWHQIEKHEAS